MHLQHWDALPPDQSAQSIPLLFGRTYQFPTIFPPNYLMLLGHLQAAKPDQALIQMVGHEFGLQSSVVAGLCSRQLQRRSLALTHVEEQTILDRPKPFFCQGLAEPAQMPRFKTNGKQQKLRACVTYTAQVLTNQYTLLREMTDLSGRDLVRATIAACDAGPEAVSHAVHQKIEVDLVTSDQNFSADVLHRAGWFQLHGWV